jgi:hypothetical protein
MSKTVVMLHTSQTPGMCEGIPNLAPLWNTKWVVYCKRPFGGPKQVLRYLARYTHRVAISNRRLIACDQKGVTFKWKDYRLEGPERYQVMTLATHEFIRRFLMHVLPAGFHRPTRQHPYWRPWGGPPPYYRYWLY